MKWLPRRTILPPDQWTNVQLKVSQLVGLRQILWILRCRCELTSDSDIFVNETWNENYEANVNGNENDGEQILENNSANAYIVQHVYDCAGQKELLRCTADLGIGDIDVHKLSSHAIRNVVFNNFVNSCIQNLFMCVGFFFLPLSLLYFSFVFAAIDMVNKALYTKYEMETKITYTHTRTHIKRVLQRQATGGIKRVLQLNQWMKILLPGDVGSDSNTCW